jgi:hypothetical protein
VTKVQLLEREVKKLDRASLETFRNWFRRYDSDTWDLQIQGDARAGKLDELSKEALTAHKSGKPGLFEALHLSKILVPTALFAERRTGVFLRVHE